MTPWPATEVSLGSYLDPAWEYYAPDPEFAEDLTVTTETVWAAVVEGGLSMHVRHETVVAGECRYCHGPIRTRSDRKTAKYCSRPCYLNHRYATAPRATKAAECPVCHGPLPRQALKFCSRQCSAVNRRKVHARTCVNCGMPFTHGHRLRKTCSDTCWRALTS